MRHCASTRILATMVAVWFGFLTMQAPYASPCPHHQPVLAELAVGMGHAADMHAMPGMSRHGQPAQDDSGRHPCDCIGVSCGTTTAIALVHGTVQWVPTLQAGTASTGISRVVDAPKIPIVHALPFATAPPTPLLA